ncbi:hypothetical protein K438DRAFT_1747398 [Mycena galopus ATCC 62051]|nr:hypothetical protein K438DRAFT_1747398 [Mycena galopus ATCC 62051]
MFEGHPIPLGTSRSSIRLRPKIMFDRTLDDSCPRFKQIVSNEVVTFLLCQTPTLKETLPGMDSVALLNLDTTRCFANWHPNPLHALRRGYNPNIHLLHPLSGQYALDTGYTPTQYPTMGTRKVSPGKSKRSIQWPILFPITADSDHPDSRDDSDFNSG